MLKVSRQPSGEPEIFHSLQGEGASAGTPSVFLRLATCNLTCTWCDTKYTWNFGAFGDPGKYDYDTEVVSLSEEEVQSRILAYGCPHLVITGGEPLIQQSALAPLATSLRERGFYCEVETNGTLTPLPEMIQGMSQWNVSPKLHNSGNRPDRREVPGALEAFRRLDSAYFKFVVVEPADVDEVDSLVERYAIPPERVILMPEGVTASAIDERGKWVAQTCVERGYRFSTRLHILLWGDKRGR